MRTITQYLKLSEPKCAPRPVHDPKYRSISPIDLASTHPPEPTWSHSGELEGGELACSSGTVTLAVCKYELSRPDTSPFASTLQSLGSQIPCRSIHPSCSSTAKTLSHCPFRSYLPGSSSGVLQSMTCSSRIAFRVWSTARWSCLHAQFVSAAYASR